MRTIDFSHLLWFFNLYSWNVHQHSLNKFGNIGTKMNKSMQRNINSALSLFIRQVNHKSCKWRSKVLKWVRTLDLYTNILPIKKGYFKVLSRGIYYQRDTIFKRLQRKLSIKTFICLTAKQKRKYQRIHDYFLYVLKKTINVYHMRYKVSEHWN